MSGGRAAELTLRHAGQQGDDLMMSWRQSHWQERLLEGESGDCVFYNRDRRPMGGAPSALPIRLWNLAYVVGWTLLCCRPREGQPKA